jgi:hypothetical protein
MPRELTTQAWIDTYKSALQHMGSNPQELQQNLTFGAGVLLGAGCAPEVIAANAVAFQKALPNASYPPITVNA